MKVIYEGVEWFAKQMLVAGVCYCQGKEKHYVAGDWTLVHYIQDYGAIKAIIPAAEFETLPKVPDVGS